MGSALIVASAIFRLAGFFMEPRLTGAEIHAVAGEPHVAAGAPDSSRVVAVTWNIERGVAFDRIARHLEQQAADVVLLQEVDRFCDRSNRVDVARALAHRLGMNWISAGEFQEVGEGRRRVACVTGQAILSRWPIENPAVIRFDDQSSAKWRLNPAQPRRGGRIALRATTGGVVVFSIHLESGERSNALRRRQLEEIIADAGQHAAVIVAGDFNNTLSARQELVAALQTSDPIDVSSSNSSARRPIEWIFVRGLDGNATVIPAEGASDHDPLVAVLQRVTRANQ
jgi:endonuclease/exonuclease/phosphatase family metal-dependent hydrolase